MKLISSNNFEIDFQFIQKFLFPVEMFDGWFVPTEIGETTYIRKRTRYRSIHTFSIVL